MIAVTGANGYVGAVLCAAFERAGHRVRRLVRTPDAARGDAAFALDRPVSAAALAGVEVLVHVAHDFRPPHEDDLRRVNVDGSRRLFEAARAAGVPRVLFVSSIACYEGSHSAYGRVKWTLEQDTAAAGGTSVRPGTVYDLDRRGLFGSLDRVVRSAPLLPDFGAGARIYTVHSGDLARVVLAWLALGAAAPPLLRAAHPVHYPLRVVLETLAAAAGRPARFVPVPVGLALAGLRAVEGLGVTMPFRSDSLVSMLHSNPSPGLTPDVLGVRLRPLDPASLNSRE